MRTLRALYVLSALSVVGIGLVSKSAHAQDAPASKAQDGEFSVQRFEPAPGPRNFLSVEGARSDGKNAFSVGLMFNYASRPFIVRSCISQTNCDVPIAANTTDVTVI